MFSYGIFCILLCVPSISAATSLAAERVLLPTIERPAAAAPMPMPRAGAAADRRGCLRLDRDVAAHDAAADACSDDGVDRLLCDRGDAGELAARHAEADRHGCDRRTVLRPHRTAVELVRSTFSRVRCATG